VQLAARVMSEVDAYGIAISSIVRDLYTDKGLEFFNMGALDLKGFKEPISVYMVMWDPDAPPPTPIGEIIEERAEGEADEAEAAIAAWEGIEQDEEAAEEPEPEPEPAPAPAAEPVVAAEAPAAAAPTPQAPAAEQPASAPETPVVEQPPPAAAAPSAEPEPATPDPTRPAEGE
jgi:hypothetical protein